MFRLRPFHAAILALILLCGCRNALPEDELRAMHNVQNGWQQILTSAEAKYSEHANLHNSLMVAVDDTSNAWRQNVLKQDSSLRVRIRNYHLDFETTSRRHLSHLKVLHTFLQDNEVWMMRVETESIPRRAARGSWEARTSEFASIYNVIVASQTSFQLFKPEYDKISKQLPGLSGAEESQPTALQNEPVLPAVQPQPPTL